MDRSDAENEGVWKWVTGPEARNYLWRTRWWFNYFPRLFRLLVNEPNQYNGAQEDYAHITAPGVGARFLE
jgi:hypothetical protein